MNVRNKTQPITATHKAVSKKVAYPTLRLLRSYLTRNDLTIVIPSIPNIFGVEGISKKKTQSKPSRQFECFIRSMRIKCIENQKTQPKPSQQDTKQSHQSLNTDYKQFTTTISVFLVLLES